MQLVFTYWTETVNEEGLYGKKTVIASICTLGLLVYIGYNNKHKDESESQDISVHTEVTQIGKITETKEILEKIDLNDRHYLENKVLEGYTFPSNLSMKSKYTDSSILVTTSNLSQTKNQFSHPEGIYEYNFKTEEMKLIADRMKDDNYINSVKYCNGYVVWGECEDQIITDSNCGRQWKIYLKNISSGEVIKIDEYNPDKSKVNNSSYRYNPNNISFSDDYIVYKICETNEKNEVIQISKLYNVKTKQLKQIRKGEAVQKEGFSEPDVDGEKVVFCRHSDVYGNSENRFSEILVYDINSGGFETIKQLEENRYYYDVKINNKCIAILK